MSILPKPIHVAIAVPMYDGMLNAGMMLFPGEAAKWGRAQYPKRYEFSVLTNHFQRPVEYARNLLVRDFLRSPADVLWFIDADMIPRESVFRVFEALEGADMACGRAHSYQDEIDKPGGVTGIKVEARTKNAHDDLFTNIVPSADSPEIQNVDACGGACLLIKRHVLEDKRLLLPTTYLDGDGSERDQNDMQDRDDWAPAIFRTLYAPNGKLIRGEDIDFTYRATQLGYTLRAHLGAEIGHFKTIDIDGVERAARQALMRHGERVVALMKAREDKQHATL